MSDPGVSAGPRAGEPPRGAAAPAQPPPSAQPAPGRPTAWVGWIWFAGLILILVGVFNAIDGLVALFQDRVVVPVPDGLLLFDVTGWGWTHLIIGIAQIVIGAGILAGMRWAMALGFLVAMLNATLQLLSLPLYPLWATIVIVLDIIVIYALVVHGDEARR